MSLLLRSPPTLGWMASMSGGTSALSPGTGLTDGSPPSWVGPGGRLGFLNQRLYNSTPDAAMTIITAAIIMIIMMRSSFFALASSGVSGRSALPAACSSRFPGLDCSGLLAFSLIR